MGKTVNTISVIILIIFVTLIVGFLVFGAIVGLKEIKLRSDFCHEFYKPIISKDNDFLHSGSWSSDTLVKYDHVECCRYYYSQDNKLLEECMVFKYK